MIRCGIKAACCALLLSLTVTSTAVAADDQANTARPKLIILISIDQFSADLFNGFRTEFREGLKQLSQGIVYANAFHAHGVTETCAGHAVIASGRHPSATGIIANQWFDQKLSVDRYCTDDGVHVAATAKRKAGVGPSLLEVSTLGDWLKAASPSNRVFSVAGKDRSAIMMGGHQPNGAFWFDGKQGFDTWGATAEEARHRLTPLAALNAQLARRLAASTQWTYVRGNCRVREARIPLADDKMFHAHLPPDPPATIAGQPAAAGSPLPPWLYDSVTVDAALSLIETERLGRSSSTDLLAIGLSATDMVGHAYGSQGPEMCDQMTRLDAELGRLLKRVEVLRIPVVIAVTADHGGGDIPERLAMRGYAEAGRIDPVALLAQLNAAARNAAGIDWNPLRPAFFDPTQLVVVDREGRTLADAALKRRIADAAATRALETSGVVGAWTGEALQARRVDPATSPDLLSVDDRMALSYFAGRSGDILLATDPLKTAAPALPGLFMMGHSGPSDFNRRVPILFWWPGAMPQERALPVEVVDLAPTLAAMIEVSPGSVDGQCIEIAELATNCGR
jgi:predicted AlkP superfamily pyrophosphatase or phosphodiesterase